MQTGLNFLLRNLSLSDVIKFIIQMISASLE